jgi:CBS domain-containing protein
MSEDLSLLLARLPGCARLSPHAMDSLAQAAQVEEHAAGVRLVVEGEPAPVWYLVLERGAVRISRLNGDADEILDHLTAGDVLDPGTPGLPAACSAMVSEAARCLLVPQSVVARHRGLLSVDAVTHGGGELALFHRRVSDLVKGPPVTCLPTVSAAVVAQLMTSRKVGSVAVLNDAGAPIGIVTDRDLRVKVLAAGLPSTTRVAEIMSSPLLSLDPARPAFDALLEMTRRDVHHIGVVAEGRLAGMVSSHDIVLLQGSHPVGLMRQIDAQADLDGLAATAPRVHTVVKWLAEEGARASEIGRIVAELNDRLVRRAIALTVARLDTEGHGRPPLPYAWLAAGSEGRREQTLKTDQDNGLVYQDPPPDLAGAAAAYFARLTAAVGEALVRLGFPPCDGGFMASNPRWCQPEVVWRGYFGTWMETPHPEQVLRASLYFDLRPIAGDERLGRDLWQWVCDRVPARTLFLRYMARAALERPAPLGFFGGFVVERSGTHKNALDLKARGVFPMTQGMRVLALSLGVADTNTLDRLRAAAERGLVAPEQADDLREAHEVIARLRLERQLACLDRGQPPDNFIDPERLRTSDRLLLKQAFKALGQLQRQIADRFHTELLA